jgi:hypothetical protein
MLSGTEITRLAVYGGIGPQYGSFSGKTQAIEAVTHLAIYGGIGVPYGSFSGKTAAVVTAHRFRGFLVNVGKLMR